MAEEISQQEKIKNFQISIATSMKVGKPVLDILSGIAEWDIREWIYICALDGMEAEQLENLSKIKASVRQIQRVRLDFLREKCAQTDVLQRKLEKLQDEVKAVVHENHEVRSSIENGLEDALRRQAQAQQDTIHAKDQLIAMQQKQIERLERKIQNIQEMEMTDESDQKKVQVEKPCMPSTQSTLFVNREPEPLKKEDKGIWKGIWKWISESKCSMDTKNFIEQYIQSDAWSEEQLEFLLSCLEDGMSIKEIEKFAAPGLSVNMMQRLKRLQRGE